MLAVRDGAMLKRCVEIQTRMELALYVDPATGGGTVLRGPRGGMIGKSPWFHALKLIKNVELTLRNVEKRRNADDMRVIAAASEAGPMLDHSTGIPDVEACQTPWAKMPVLLVIARARGSPIIPSR